jgi:cell wall-associated NlpC family hydrolase
MLVEMIATVVSREDAVKAARSWIGTPRVLRGRVKGAGVDCGTLIAEYLIEIGAATRQELEDLGFYTDDWFCHATNERYLLHLIRYAHKVLEGRCRGTVEVEPGSLILFRVVGSKYFNHGGILTHWPFMVHAEYPVVKERNCVTHHLTGFTEFAVFDPWGKA